MENLNIIKAILCITSFLNLSTCSVLNNGSVWASWEENVIILTIFFWSLIHISIYFSKHTSSPESLSDPHMEDLTINADIVNTKFIITNIYIPPASCCSNGYQSSIEDLLTTPDTLSLLISRRTIRHGTQDRLIQKEEEWTTQSTDLTMVSSTGRAPREIHQTQSRVRQISL